MTIDGRMSPGATRRAVTRAVAGALAGLGTGRGVEAREGLPEPDATGRSFYYSGPVSDHFDGRRFFNPDGAARPKGFAEVLRWRLSNARASWPQVYPSPFAGHVPGPAGPGLSAVLVGHATFLIRIGGLTILTDPVWSDRASPFSAAGPRRHNPPGIAFADLPRIDAVLVSHNHYDHLDLPTLQRLWNRDRPRILAPLGNDAIVRAYDPRIEVATLDWGGRAQLARGVTVHMVPAQHWSARALTDRNHALWGGFVVAGGGHSVYFAGDTGFREGLFRGIAARHRRIDLALLPIGAYEPRWFMREQHMNPDDAVRAFRLLRARQALGFHWGTFQLTDEAIEQPVADLATALTRHRVAPSRFLAARPGQSWPGGR